MNNIKDAIKIVQATITSGAKDDLLVLHRKAHEVLAHKAGMITRRPNGSINGQPGWYWVDKTSGLMIKAGDEGRLYIRGHYKDGHKWVVNVTTQIPAQWLGLDALRTLYAQFVTGPTKTFCTVGMHVLAVHVWSHSALRELFQKLLLEKNLCVHLDEMGNIAEYNYTQNKGFVRAEHNIKGLRGFRFPTHSEVKCIKDVEGGLVAFEDPSKLNERVVKIFGNSDGMFVGKWKAIVIISQPKCDDAIMQAELDNAFCTGTTYSSGMFRFIGAARLVTKSLGGKMTITSPFSFKEFGDHAVIGNLSSWKGGLNMLLNHTGVMSVEEQIEFCTNNPNHGKKELTAMALDRLADAGLIKTTTVQYRGHAVELEYVETEEEFYATNLYVLYGCQYKEVDAVEQDSSQYETTSLASSYYLHMKEQLKQAVDAQDWDFSLSKVVKNDIEIKLIVKSKPLTSFSIREMVNFFWSYCVYQNENGVYVVDSAPMNDLIEQLLKENGKKASATHKAMQRLAVNGYGDLPRIQMAHVSEFIKDVFSIKEDIMGMETITTITIPERGWSRMESGLSKLDDDQFADKWSKLMNGHMQWPGLAKDGFVIEVEEFDFFIPGFKFLKSAIMPVDKNTYAETNEAMFGDIMQTIMQLLIAIRRHGEGKTVEWSFNAAQHLIRTNASLFEDRYNRMAVTGTYLTISPKFWGVDDEGYEHSVATFAARPGHMCYSKDPVLFDKAVTGVVNKHNFPRDLFGEIDPIDRFAMESVAFINNDLLMSQENDSDGDLCCLRYKLVLPLYTGQWDYLAKRVAKYVSGEREYNMVMKPWKFYNKDELAIGIHSNRMAKENIGLMSSGLFQHSMLLENAIRNGGMNLFWGKMLWNLYGYIVQDEAMRMIKHSGGQTSDTGRSGYYEATSILKLLGGDTNTMYLGNDEDTKDGFLYRIGDYWANFDVNNSRHSSSLKDAISAYVIASKHFCFSNYKSSGKYQVSGHQTGRLVGNNPAGLQLALDIASRKCINNQYKLFNVLQRGYFRHVEDTRLMKSHADAMVQVLAKHGMPEAANAVDVIVAVRKLFRQEVRVPAPISMSLAFRLDAQARNGWFAQHTYIGRLNVVATSNDIAVRRWINMVMDATKVQHQVAKTTDEQVVQAVIDDLTNGGGDINYPDLNNWGG